MVRFTSVMAHGEPLGVRGLGGQQPIRDALGRLGPYSGQPFELLEEACDRRRVAHRLHQARDAHATGNVIHATLLKLLGGANRLVDRRSRHVL